MSECADTPPAPRFKTYRIRVLCYKWVWNVIISVQISFSWAQSVRSNRFCTAGSSRTISGGDNIYDLWHLLALLLILQLYNYFSQLKHPTPPISLPLLNQKIRTLLPLCYNTLLLAKESSADFMLCSSAMRHNTTVTSAGLLKSFSSSEEVFKGSGLDRALSVRDAHCLPRILK